MARMMFRLRLRALCCALAAIACLAGAVPASASVRAGGSPRCTSNGDWPPLSAGPLFEDAISVEPGNTLRRVVTVDFDRDGDLDVLASTDRGIRVWLNDGQGNLVSQPPQTAEPISDSTGVRKDAGVRQDSSESIQNDLPSFSAPPSRARAVRAPARSLAFDGFAVPLRSRSRSSLVPRAPPV